MVDIIFDNLVAELKETKIFKVTGESKDKFANVEEFKNYQGNSILVASDVINFGINLECVDVVMNFDLPFTHAKLTQRIGRGDRMTRTLPLLVINLITKNTIEERICEILETKKDLFDIAIAGEKLLIKELFKDFEQKRGQK